MRHVVLRNAVSGFVVGALLVCGGTPSYAGLLISLSSAPSDLGNVHATDLVRVDVNLSGLGAGEELTTLSARVTFDGGFLGTPSISPGDILPVPLDDPLDFLATPDLGAADATFLTLGTLPASHITSNGVFYSFDVAVHGLGMSEFALTFVDAQQVDPQDPQNLITPSISVGEPLAINSVPEPSTFALGCCGIGALVAIRRRMRRTTRRRNSSRRCWSEPQKTNASGLHSPLFSR